MADFEPPAALWDCGCLLGEGPVYDERAQALYFVDIERPAILRYALGDGTRQTFVMPEKTGFVALRESGGMIAGLQSGFAFVDLAGAEPLLEPITDPEPHLPGNRFNDGKCDAFGRLFAGTMDDAIESASGTLYRLDPDLSVHALDSGYVVTNGPAFAPDGRTLYHNDSTERTVYAFDCDPDTGAITNKRVFVTTTGDEGVPDGLCVDDAGYVWLAHWDGWRVTRFAPDGTVDRVVPLPVARVTSCAFGGDHWRTLFITTARTGLDAAHLTDQPLAGALFALEVDVAGQPTRRFAG